MTTYNAPFLANTGNTAVGFASLRNSLTGTNNVALGYEALRNTLGNGNIGIGFQAGRTETGSDKLYIENSNADANGALIYGDFNTNILRVNGQVQVGNPAVAGYAFPTSRGTNTQVLQTNGSGSSLGRCDYFNHYRNRSASVCCYQQYHPKMEWNNPRRWRCG